MSTNTTLHRRSSLEELFKESQYFTKQLPFQYFSDSLSEYVAVLNKNRQIVFCNQPLVGYLNAVDTNHLMGKRLGEAWRCAHANETTGGCGTTESCKLCGAFKAISESQTGTANVQECRIVRDGDSGALDLSVRATPYSIGEDPFTIVAVTDISNEKRRKVLESLFFHDVLNVVGGLMGYSELMKDAEPDEMKEFASAIKNLSVELNEQISSQRELNKAEHHNIQISNILLHSKSLLESIIISYKKHAVSEGKNLFIDPCADDFLFISDETILRRIIGNLVKNALEATEELSTVLINCQRKIDGIEFSVSNKEVIPNDIKLQIFQRSFSTKGEGRGLGTYSVKLFTEQYLGGKVSFTSNEDDGTVFRIMLPITPFSNNQSKSKEIETSIEEIFAEL